MGANAVIVLAGGRSSRMGVDKSNLLLDGARQLDRTLAAVAGYPDIVVVGPHRPGPHDRWRATQEDPPFGGPVAGIAAGLAALGAAADEAEVLVVAVDLPHVAEVVAALRGVAMTGDGVCLVDAEGVLQTPTGRFRLGPLRVAIASLPAKNASVRRLVDPLSLVTVKAPVGVTDDLDTPDDAARHGFTFAATNPVSPA